ncbi:MAG: acetylxylan esterase [Phycisphaerales bacterium]|nr:acetylxylan esterase [Phycisphaerales bacterium]
MVEPDDFGMSAAATLARVASVSMPGWAASLWQHWQQQVKAAPCRLNEFRGRSPDASDASATHWVESVGHVRLGCRVVEPRRGAAVRGGLVALHGYVPGMPLSGEEDEWQGPADRGVLVVAMRVRGFAGSRIDCGDYTGADGGEANGWISRGLATEVRKGADAMDFVLAQGIADVVCVLRAVRHELTRRAGAGAPLMVHGPSFGGGLAVLAAAQGSLLNGSAVRVDRLVVEHPSLGDWAWRLRMGERAARAGIGADVWGTMRAMADRAEAMGQMLSAFDAVGHARHVLAPCLAMLAARDETVPAPTAAAIVNGLSTDPGQRWRFLTPYGHFDGGLRNERRRALFAACRDDFLDPGVSALASMARWEPMMERGERGPGSAGD